MLSIRKLAFACVCVSTALAQTCPAPAVPSSFPKWIWESIEYTSSNSDVTTAMSSVATAWSGAGDIDISPSGIYDDVEMSSGSLPSGTLGLTSWISQSSSTCYMMTDTNGTCMDRSVMYYMTVEIDTAQISTQATAQSPNYANFVESVVAHEIGHVFGLDDNRTLTAPVTCSTVVSIMQQGGNLRTGCGVLLPTSCDTDGVDDAYDDWTVGAYYACSGSGCL
jgi:hypothetical protein